jgi:hypothetical protein
MKYLSCVPVCFYLCLILSSCSSIDEIKIPPANYANDNPLTYKPSVISASVILPLKDIERKANELAEQGYSGEDSDEFHEQYRAKTKNPLYNPNKWMYTKNPFYNGRKWLKACILGACAVTKNPAYDPKKDIKTKNPAYNPNKWLYADTVEVDIGYTWAYQVEKYDNKKIQFTLLKDDVLRLTLPIELKGSVGFKGDGAKVLSLTKKNLHAGIELYVDTKINLTKDWCPVLNIDYDYEWLSDPKLELADDLWVSLKAPLDIVNMLKKSDIKNAIKSAIDCDKIKGVVESKLGPVAIELTKDRTNFPNILKGIGDYYFNAKLNRLETTGLKLNNGNLSLGINASINTFVSEKEISAEGYILPPLILVDKIPINYLAATVPAIVSYKELESLINKESLIKMINETMIDEIAKVDKFEFYPTGDALTVKVNLTVRSKENKYLAFLAKFPILGGLFDTSGDIYLTSNPIFKDNELRLDNVNFGLNVDSEIYPVLSAAFKGLIVSILESEINYDFSDFVAQAEKAIPALVAEKLNDTKGISLKLIDTVVESNEAVIVRENELAVILALMTGFEANINLSEL